MKRLIHSCKGSRGTVVCGVVKLENCQFCRASLAYHLIDNNYPCLAFGWFSQRSDTVRSLVFAHKTNNETANLKACCDKHCDCGVSLSKSEMNCLRSFRWTFHGGRLSPLAPLSWSLSHNSGQSIAKTTRHVITFSAHPRIICQHHVSNVSNILSNESRNPRVRSRLSSLLISRDVFRRQHDAAATCRTSAAL